jgi:ABC-type arginine transport system permease subunit
VIQLTRDRWVLEVYRTIIESLQGLAWLLLVFFAVALLAFVIVRVFELKKGKTSPSA